MFVKWCSELDSLNFYFGLQILNVLNREIIQIYLVDDEISPRFLSHFIHQVGMLEIRMHRVSRAEKVIILFS